MSADVSDAVTSLINSTVAFIVSNGGDVAEEKLRARTSTDGKLAFLLPNHTRHAEFRRRLQQHTAETPAPPPTSSSLPPPPPPPSPPPPLADRLRTHISQRRNAVDSSLCRGCPVISAPLSAVSALTVIAAVAAVVNGDAASERLALSRYADAVIRAADRRIPQFAATESAVRHIADAYTTKPRPPPPHRHFDCVLARVRSAAQSQMAKRSATAASTAAVREVGDVDWAQFTVIHRAEFVAAERAYLPPPANSVAEMRALADVDVAAAPPIISAADAGTTDNTATATAAAATATATATATIAPSSSALYERCVVCRELILVSELSEHLRIELTGGPQRRTAAATAVGVSDRQLAQNVAAFANKRRHDVDIDADADSAAGNDRPTKQVKAAPAAVVAAADTAPPPAQIRVHEQNVRPVVSFTLTVVILSGIVSDESAPTSFSLTAASSDTVESIKARIAERIGLAANKIKLCAHTPPTFLNRDQSTLAEYNVTADTAITAALKERGRSARK